MDIDLDDQSDIDQEDVQLEDDLDHNAFLRWDEMWQFIIQRNAGVVEIEPPTYTDDAWTLDPKDRPLLLNLEATWYCAGIVVILLAIHAELDTLWLTNQGYTQYISRISYRIALTVALSFVSMIAYEILGNMHELFRDSVEARLLNMDAVQLFLDRIHSMEAIKAAVSDVLGLIFQYLALLISSTLGYAGPAVFIWAVSWISTNVADFLSNLATILALPTPGIDGVFGLKTLLWEFGVPAYFQVWIAALLYLSVFLFMSKAETPSILGLGHLDPFYKLAYELTRAISMHLLAYTAYQLVCICVVATKNFLLAGQAYNPLIDDPLTLKSNAQIAPVAGMLVLGAHWLVKRSCKICARLAWPLYVPYIVWLSIKTRDSTLRNWYVYKRFLDRDMEVLNPDKRVISRALMTAMFGLKSSWPARMRLSSVDNVD